MLFPATLAVASPGTGASDAGNQSAPAIVPAAQSSATSAARDDDPIALSDEGAATPDAFRFEGSFTSPWTRAAASRIALSQDLIIPFLIEAPQPFEDGIYAWDAWPILTPDGTIAEFDGWVAMVGLTAETDANSDYPFYTRSTWRYWYTKDGDWMPGGVIFERTEALGSRQWAGSTIYDPDTGRVTFYYTAVGAPDAASLKADAPTRPLSASHPGAGRPNTEQRMAEVSATLNAGPNGIAFSDFSEHRLILEADGEIYAAETAFIPENVIYGMRDPQFWRDTETGRDYILFTANSAGLPPPHNGVVGIAERRETGAWHLLRPVVASAQVSSQLERPHVVRRNDGLYLFFSTHAFTFGDGLSGPEGLYGFHNPDGDIHGQFAPINGHGLVAGNPPGAPVQVYSFYVLPDGHVMSYVNTPWGFGDDPDESREFVGAPAPLFRIALEKGRARIAAAPDTVLTVD